MLPADNHGKLVEAKELAELSNELKAYAGDILRNRLSPVVADFISTLGVIVIRSEKEVRYDPNGDYYIGGDYFWTVRHRQTGFSAYLHLEMGTGFKAALMQIADFQAGTAVADIHIWPSKRAIRLSGKARQLFECLQINRLEDTDREAAYWALENWKVALGKESEAEPWFWDHDRSDL